jgi:hypothetical protein
VIYVRKLIVPTIALAFAGVPAAFAASGSDRRTAKRDLISAKLFERYERELRAAKRRARRADAAPSVSVPPQLQAIAQCESHGNPRAVSANGTYRGKYQFSTSTWAAVGGKGDPAAAPEAEQDLRAALLYARSGPGQWPVCGS